MDALSTSTVLDDGYVLLSFYGQDRMKEDGMGLYTRKQLIEKLLAIEDDAYGWHINGQVSCDYAR